MQARPNFHHDEAKLPKLHHRDARIAPQCLGGQNYTALPKSVPQPARTKTAQNKAKN